MKQLEKLIALFDVLLKELGNELKNKYAVSLTDMFRDKDDEFFNNTTKLRSSRGSKSLKADLIKGAKVKVSNGKIDIDFSTDKPYAGVQNSGAFIRANPVQVKTETGKRKQTYRMAQYFWYKHATEDVERKKTIYKIMALSVQKRGGIKIRGKFYIQRSLKDFEDKHLERVLQQFYLQTLKIWNG